MSTDDKAHLESDIQRRLTTRARQRGCVALKIVSQSMRGMPDLIVIRDARIVFWEVKSTKGRLTPLQILMHKQLRDRGATAIVTYGLYEAFEALNNLFPVGVEPLQVNEQSR